jgi:hypothetical protein
MIVTVPEDAGKGTIIYVEDAALELRDAFKKRPRRRHFEMLRLANTGKTYDLDDGKWRQETWVVSHVVKPGTKKRGRMGRMVLYRKVGA